MKYLRLIIFQILGIDSEFCLVESFVTGVVDNWSETLRPHREKFTVLICIIMFLLGIPMVTHVSLFLYFTISILYIPSSDGISILLHFNSNLLMIKETTVG